MTAFVETYARELANTRSCPEAPVHYEPMFVHMKKIPAKAADALDLMIELATLGEYGLEYPELPVEARTTAPCGPGPVRTRTRTSTRIERPVRIHTRPAVTKPARSRRGVCGDKRATTLPEALMPPRIKLDV